MAVLCVGGRLKYLHHKSIKLITCYIFVINIFVINDSGIKFFTGIPQVTVMLSSVEMELEETSILEN